MGLRRVVTGWRRGVLGLMGFTAMIFVLGVSLGASQCRAAAKDYKITILGGSAGGVWSVITEGVAESIRRGISGAQITTEPGKDGPNQVMISRGDVQFAVTHDSTNFSAVNAMEPYKKEYGNLRTAAVLNPTSAFQFIIDQKTGIKRFQDIKEKKYGLRIGANRRGTLMHLSGQKVLEAYGITYADIEKWGGKIHYVRSGQSVDLWDAGQLDAAQEVSQFPSSRYLEHGTKHDLRLLPVDREKMAVLEKALGMKPLIIPANTYPFQKEDVLTINTKLILLTSMDQPEQMVYDVVKAMYDHLDYLHKVHANLRDLTPEIMCQDVMVELHPGSAKFFKEVGALK